jgi:hypothetical protein
MPRIDHGDDPGEEHAGLIIIDEDVLDQNIKHQIGQVWGCFYLHYQTAPGR